MSPPSEEGTQAALDKLAGCLDAKVRNLGICHVPNRNVQSLLRRHASLAFN